MDAAEDVAVFIVDFRGNRILYCNHVVTLKTGWHAGSEFDGLWDKCQIIAEKCKDGTSFYCYEPDTPFGKSKNVTVCQIVWTGGLKAYSFMITSHVENKEEHEREIIFNTLGRSYLNIQTIDFENDRVDTIFSKEHGNNWFFRPMSFAEWHDVLLFDYIHPDDEYNVRKYLDENLIESELTDNEEIIINFRRLVSNEEYRWTEFRITCLQVPGGKKIVCTQRDIHNECVINRNTLKNQMIMQSLANVYRSVYLLDLSTGEYSTVKQDKLLFGIPKEGLYDEILQIASELIPDDKQRKDLFDYFSLPALIKAFGEGMENIGREYNSRLSKDVDWMNISIFRPPGLKGLENKCVLTFMDISEHKRVEAERNEINVAIDVLSSKYVAVFLVKGSDYSFHTIKIPSNYRILEHQYDNILEMFSYYLSAYVLEEYRDILRKNINFDSFAIGSMEEKLKQEYIFKNIYDKWIRMVIAVVPGSDDADTEFIIAFEDYEDIMEQHSLSVIYSKMMLADYENMFEYDAENDTFYELKYDGERLIREAADGEGNKSLEFHAIHSIHPDDLPIFFSACSKETIERCIENNKSVTHLYLRKMQAGEYHSYMYGFHYYEEYGKKCVLIMERDADKEIV